MYPYELFLGLDLYGLFMAIGVIGCLVIFRIMADTRALSAKFQNFVLVCAVVTVVGGYALAVVTQALYNIKTLGRFVINMNTGATFYGGLVGGIAVFVIIYFGIGHFYFKTNYHLKVFRLLSDIAACCIPAAHAMGRFGCLMAGCCHGATTDAWYGIYMVGKGKVVPVQLFEALFLCALAAFLIFWFIKKKRYGMPIYLASYGIWRFFIEYARADYRGDTLVDFLTPSQLTSVLLVMAAAVVFAGELYFDRRAKRLGEAAYGADGDE